MPDSKLHRLIPPSMPSLSRSGAAQPPPYPDDGGSTSVQLYAPPDAEAFRTPRRTQAFPEDISRPPLAIYGFSVLPSKFRPFNTTLESMTVTDPDSKVLFHFRYNGNPLETSMTNPSFLALVPGPQREPNPLQNGQPLKLWDKGAKSVKEWIWRRKCNKPEVAFKASGESIAITRRLESGERLLDSEGKTLKRTWTEFEDLRGGRLRWSCSAFLVSTCSLLGALQHQSLYANGPMSALSELERTDALVERGVSPPSTGLE